MARGRTSKGKQKIEIKRIFNEDARQVTFSRRRMGVFKKANELSILCGAEIAVVVFSIAGRVYSFRHPSVEAVGDRFVSGSTPRKALVPPTLRGSAIRKVIKKYDEMSATVEVGKKRRKALEEALKGVEGERAHELDANLSRLRLQELEEYKAGLLEFQRKVTLRRGSPLLAHNSNQFHLTLPTVIPYQAMPRIKTQAGPYSYCGPQQEQTGYPSPTLAPYGISFPGLGYPWF